MTNKIMSTKNYALFKLLKFNRPINEAKVQSMIRSFQEGLDLFSHFPIVVDRNMNIFDGQHRFETCRRLELPVFYTQMERGSTIDNVSSINNNQTRWTTLDFVNAYIQKGKEDYAHLKTFYENSGGLSLSTCADILSQRIGSRSNISDGTFTMGSMKKAVQILSIIKPLLEIDKRKYRDRTLIQTIIVMYRIPDFNPELFVNKCRLRNDYVKHCRNVKEQLWNLNEVYNFKTRVNGLNLFRPEFLSSIKDK